MRLLLLFISFVFPLAAHVHVGADTLVTEKSFSEKIQHKRIGLISNLSAINHEHQTTLEVLQKHAYEVRAVFAPEHGYFGNVWAGESLPHQKIGEIPLHSMFGETRKHRAVLCLSKPGMDRSADNGANAFYLRKGLARRLP